MIDQVSLQWEWDIWAKTWNGEGVNYLYKHGKNGVDRDTAHATTMIQEQAFCVLGAARKPL